MANAAPAGVQHTISSSSPSGRQETAARLMASFAERTQRYLWTDAFAVCNFLGLARVTGSTVWLDRALALVDDVHHTLGRHRRDDPRSGWISGLSDREGEERPTAGGLRIGKLLPERAEGEPLDSRLEWERDGQYFHYLTKWMHALDVLARTRRDVRLHRWSVDLASAAYHGFVHGRRMHWKTSIALSRPLVPSMGQHDPLDGYVTYLQIQQTGRALADAVELEDAIDSFAAILERVQLETDDPLGLGGLLTDAHRLEQLGAQGVSGLEGLHSRLLSAARIGLDEYCNAPDLRMPAASRLAFRELGLAIGLAAAERLATNPLSRYLPLRAEIESFWSNPRHQSNESWTEHRDIDEVMLATALLPDGFVTLPNI